MKTILNLKGVKTLSKEEQTGINGSARNTGCTQRGGQCCVNTGGPRGVFCDAGRCTRWGCVWY